MYHFYLLEGKEGAFADFRPSRYIHLGPLWLGRWDFPGRNVGAPFPLLPRGVAGWWELLPSSQQRGMEGVNVASEVQWGKGREKINWNQENVFRTINTCRYIAHQMQRIGKSHHFKKVNTLAELIAVLPLKFQCNFWFLILLFIFQLSRF